MDNFMNLFVLIIIVAVMLPILIVFITTSMASVDPTTAILLGLLPVAIVIGILKSVNAYSQPLQRFIRGE